MRLPKFLLVINRNFGRSLSPGPLEFLDETLKHTPQKQGRYV